jgi:hypothetical protein
MVASMSITGRFMDALNPVDVFGLIARIPLAYFGMLAIIGALWLVPALLFSLTGAASLLPNLVLVAIAMYLWLAMLACVGGIIYDHREELGYEPNESPERAAARANAELDRDRDKVMDTIFAEYRGHAFANAGASVRKIMDGSRTPLVEFRWLYARAARWADPRMAEYLVQYCLPKLLQARASGEALDLVRERLRANETFRPLAAAHVLQMATLARDGGDKPTARRLLSDFDQRFPNDPAAPLAAKLSAEIAR